MEIQRFSATQILSEIKFGNFVVSKTAILTFLVTQNIQILGILNTLICGIFPQKSTRGQPSAAKWCPTTVEKEAWININPDKL